jgi:hypothetical protein
MTEREIQDLVVEANKAGFRGVRIVGLAFPTSAVDDPTPKFITAAVPSQAGSDTPWDGS